MLTCCKMLHVHKKHNQLRPFPKYSYLSIPDARIRILLPRK